MTIVVPFHKGLPFLDRALAGLTPLAPGDELLVIADAAVDDPHALAASYGARVVEIPGPSGPAVARNVAATLATGDVLLFVDADVVASPATVERVAQVLAARPDVDAVFGAYDDHPGAPGFFAQYKNLAHSYYHRISNGDAKTFWAGFGAVRRDAFLAVGGFDTRFARPSIEDIDLGYRLSAAGFRIRLDPSLAVCHLKRWTFGSMVRSDVLDRGIPWTQLILRYGQFGSDLNVRTTDRLCVVAAYAAVAFAALAWLDPRALWPALAALAVIAVSNRDYYAFFQRRRGTWFALRVFPLHVLYYLYNGVSFGAGTALFVAAQRFGLNLPGGLPATPPEAGAGLPAVATGRSATSADVR